MDARLDAIEDQLTAEGESLEPVQQVYQEIQKDLIRARATLAMLRSAHENGTLLDMPSIQLMLYHDPEYASLRQQEEQRMANIRMIQRRYDGPPVPEEMKAALASVESQLTEKENQLIEDLLGEHAQQVADLEFQAAAIEAELSKAEAAPE